jgi:hypothetical protein
VWNVMPFVYISSSGSEGCSPKYTAALVQVPSGAVERSANLSPSGSALASTVIGNGPILFGASPSVSAPRYAT